MQTPDSQATILFDGYCNFCSRIAVWIARHDSRNRFRLCAASGDAGKIITSQFNIGHVAGETIILIENGKVFYRSDAILRILKKLDGILPALWVFNIIPRFLRDFIYGIIARNRYRWFGKKNACFVPDEKLKNHFL